MKWNPAAKGDKLENLKGTSSRKSPDLNHDCQQVGEEAPHSEQHSPGHSGPSSRIDIHLGAAAVEAASEEEEETLRVVNLRSPQLHCTDPLLISPGSELDQRQFHQSRLPTIQHQPGQYPHSRYPPVLPQSFSAGHSLNVQLQSTSLYRGSSEPLPPPEVDPYREAPQRPQLRDDRSPLRSWFDLVYWTVYVHTCLQGWGRRRGMTSVLGGRHVTQSGRTVRYTPCAKGEHTDDEELEEIAVVDDPARTDTPISAPLVEATSSATSSFQPGGASRRPSHVTDPSAQGAAADTDDAVPVTTANGPRLLPSTGTSFGNTAATSDRTRLIGERLSTTGLMSISSPVYAHKIIEQKSTSRASLYDLLQHKINRGKKGRAFSKESVAYVNRAHTSDAMTPKEVRKQRRKEIAEKFGKDHKNNFERLETSTQNSDKDGCKWTFVFDPAGRLAYWWSFVVSISFLYNFWVLIYRFAFEEINSENMAIWFTLDYFADLIYIMDIAFHFRTGYLEDGVLQTDSVKLRLHYLNSTVFYIDCLCLLPLDFLYLSIGFKSMLRCFRLVKIYRFWTFLDRTERHTNYPNVVRTVTLLHYLFAIYHWNACVMYLVTKHLDNDRWLYPSGQDGSKVDVLTLYLHSLYWSTLTLTTIGDLPRPKAKGEYVFVICEFVFGLLLFSSVLGHVAHIVTSLSAARKDFQGKVSSIVLANVRELAVFTTVFSWRNLPKAFSSAWHSFNPTLQNHTAVCSMPTSMRFIPAHFDLAAAELNNVSQVFCKIHEILMRVLLLVRRAHVILCEVSHWW